MTIFAADLDAVIYVINHFLLPYLAMMAAFFLVGMAIGVIGTKLVGWWLHSALRARYLRMSKAKVSFLNGVIDNLLVVLLCLPLLQVPGGSGIKPMTLPALMLLIAVVTAVSCQRISEDARRPDGSKLLHFVGNCLCLLPLVVGVFVMHLFAAMRNLTFG